MTRFSAQGVAGDATSNDVSVVFSGRTGGPAVDGHANELAEHRRAPFPRARRALFVRSL